MRLASPRVGCATSAALLTAITFAAGIVVRAETVATVTVHPTPMAREDRAPRPVLAWARPTVCERGPPACVDHAISFPLHPLPSLPTICGAFGRPRERSIHAC
jgi:hypothetical protein